jgi:hypothetical protein
MIYVFEIKSWGVSNANKNLITFTNLYKLW